MSADDMPQFSGDFNPIHFDPMQARRIGASALIVHGMLALLSVKQRLVMQAPPINDGWLRFKTLLRKPIAHDAEIVLSFKSSKRGLQFQALSSARDEYFRGSFAGISAPAVDVEAPFSTTVIEAAVANAFVEYYGSIHASWSALDSIIFADFMSSKAAMLLAYTRTHVQQIFGSDVRDGLILHASHDVRFDAVYFAELPAHALANCATSYDVLTPNLIGNADQCICTVQLSVRAADRIVMTIELGLVLKYALDATLVAA
jgi:hypothetical protein